jgi:opacity protein-like surface antigen
MRTILALLAAAASLPAAASAQEAGRYVQLHGGVFLPTADGFEAETFGAADEPVRLDAELDTETGFAVGALFGYGIAPRIAVEGEVTYRSYDAELEGVVIAGGDVEPEIFPVPVGGSVETIAFMVNGVYALTEGTSLVPYLGIGAGYLTPIGDSDELEGSLAFQAKLGATVPAGRGGFVGEVSYLRAGDLDLEDALGEASIETGGVTALVGYRLSL